MGRPLIDIDMEKIQMTDSFERESDINLLGSVSQLVMKSMQKSE